MMGAVHSMEVLYAMFQAPVYHYCTQKIHSMNETKREGREKETERNKAIETRGAPTKEKTRKRKVQL